MSEPISLAALHGLAGGLGGLISTSRNEAPAFDEPWQAEVFATTVALIERGVFNRKQWVDRFSAEIRDRPQRPNEDVNTAYYRQWLAALEDLLSSNGITEKRQIDETQEAWRRSYLHTKHGTPVELHRGLPDIDWDADDDEHHHEDEDHANLAPVSVSPAS